MPQPSWTNSGKMAETSRSSSVDLPSVLSEYRDLVENALREKVPQQDIAPYTSLRYHMGWCDQDGNPRHDAEGKRLRPALLLLACQAAGGATESALGRRIRHGTGAQLLADPRRHRGQGRAAPPPSHRVGHLG